MSNEIIKPRNNEPIGVATLTGGRLLARNALGNVASQFVPIVIAILTLPVTIRVLGTDRFGIVTLAWMVLGYFSLFDLGLGRALTQAVSERLGRGEENAVPGLVWTALSLMALLGMAGGVLVVILTPWVIREVLQVPAAIQEESIAAFFWMGVALPFVILTAGLRGVMEAYQRFAAVIAIRTVTSLAILIVPLFTLFFTKHLDVFVGVVAFLRFVACLAHFVYCLKTFPGLRTGYAPKAELIRPLLGFGGWMTAVNVINPLMVQMDRFLIAGLVSASAVAFYTTPFELITRAWFLSGSIVVVMFPAFAATYTVDRARTAAIFERCLKSVLLILFPISLVGVALGHEILLYWVGADFASAGTRVMQWLALGVLLNGLAQVPSALIQAAGRPDLTFKLHMAELPPYLLAAWLLTSRYGIEGAAVAWVTRIAIDLYLYFMAAGWVLQESSQAIRRAWSGVIPAVAVLAVAAAPLSLSFRAIVLVAGCAAFTTFAWTRLLDESERSMVRDHVASLQARVRLALWSSSLPLQANVEINDQTSSC